MVNVAADRPSMAIDLGSKYSRVGVWQNERVEIVPSKSGDRFTPTVVAFTDTQVLIGEPATQQQMQNSQNTIFDITSLIGRKFSDHEIQECTKHWPFKVVCGPEDTPQVVVSFKGESKSFQPVEILAMFLSEMREMAESYTGKRVEDALVTAPVRFNHFQRQAIKDASALAGLNVARLISAPTAACIAYGFDKRTETGVQTVLSCDLGSSTLDISLVSIESAIYEVSATTGVSHLGGDDFDSRLVEYCVAEFNRIHGKDLQTNLRAMARLRGACERAKRTLSTSTETQIEIDSLHEGVDFHLPVSRSQFEKCCADLFDKAVEAVEKVLEDAKVKKCQVDEIVLVGGSSRIPKMQQLLSKLFDGRKLAGTITKEEAAAIGAAIQAAVLAGDDVPKLQDLLLLNVMSMSLQMEVNGAKTVVIPRNCTIPMKRTQTISTSPGKNSVVRFHFFEGDSENARGKLQLGILDMDGVLIDKAEFDVTIDIDASSNWSASVVEKLTGKEKEFTINCSSLPASEAGSALKDAEKDKSSRRVSGALGKVRSMFSGFMPRGSKQKSKLKLRQSAEDETKQRQVDSTGTKLDHIKISLASVGAK